MRTGLRAISVAISLSALGCRGEAPSAPAPITALPRALSAAEQGLIEADNRFAFKLLGALTAQTRDTLPNLFVSPLSVAMALAMTYNGAAGSTEDAMRAVLELEGISVNDVNAGYRDLIALLRGLDPQVRFLIANSIWYRQGFTVLDPFLDANRTYYDARVEALDFASPAAPQIINGWVNEQTNGLIPDIVPSPLPDWAVMYLINAIYFKGNWTQRFDKALTAPRPFRLADGSVTAAPAMTHGKPADLRVYGDTEVQVVDLPYGGGAYSATIVMPREPQGIEALVDGLTGERWDAWTAALDSTALQVFLPKFKLTNDLSLVTVLRTLGMEIAFDCDPPEMADFTRMHVPQEVCITNVKHKTYVDVNEEGTEAAAVTSVEIGFTSVSPSVVVDRPFLFALRENLSGTILFLGVIRNPVAN
jgi:serpin B